MIRLALSVLLIFTLQGCLKSNVAIIDRFSAYTEFPDRITVGFPETFDNAQGYHMEKQGYLYQGYPISHDRRRSATPNTVVHKPPKFAFSAVDDDMWLVMKASDPLYHYVLLVEDKGWFSSSYALYVPKAETMRRELERVFLQGNGEAFKGTKIEDDMAELENRFRRLKDTRMFDPSGFFVNDIHAMKLLMKFGFHRGIMEKLDLDIQEGFAALEN